MSSSFFPDNFALRSSRNPAVRRQIAANPHELHPTQKGIMDCAISLTTRIGCSGKKSRGWPFRLRSILRLKERRDRAIEGVGDGAEDFGFAGLDEIVEGNGLGAGGQDVLLNLRDGLCEAI
jgi:hypothetical protein